MTAILRCPSAAVSIYLFIYLCTVCVCVRSLEKFLFRAKDRRQQMGKIAFSNRNRE